MGIIRSETAQISLKHSGLNFVGFRQSKSRKTFITLRCLLLSPFQPHSHGFATLVSCWSSLAFCKDRGKALRALLCVLSWELSLPAVHQARFFLGLPLTVYMCVQSSISCSWCPLLIVSPFLPCLFFSHLQMFLLLFHFFFFFPLKLTQFPLSLSNFSALGRCASTHLIQFTCGITKPLKCFFPKVIFFFS